MSKFMIRLLRHDDTVHREDDGAVRLDHLAELFKLRFAGTSCWLIQAWISFLVIGGGPKKRFQCCLNPNSSEHFMYFPAVQELSGGTLVDLALQDNVLFPDDFADYIYHIGNAHDMHSIIQSALIPGGRSLKRDRQSVFSTAVNPMYANQDQEQVQYDLDIQKYLENSQKHSVLVQYETRSEKRIAVLSNTIPRNRSFQHLNCDMY